MGESGEGAGVTGIEQDLALLFGSTKNEIEESEIRKQFHNLIKKSSNADIEYIISFSKNLIYRCSRCNKRTKYGEDVLIIHKNYVGDNSYERVCKQCGHDEKIRMLSIRLHRKYKRCSGCNNWYRNLDGHYGKYCDKCKETKSEMMKYYQIAKNHLNRELEIQRPWIKKENKFLGFFEWEVTKEYFDNKCAYCDGVVEVREHFIPVERGGTFSLGNIISSCHSCNLRKGNLDPFEFISGLDKEKRKKIITWVSVYCDMEKYDDIDSIA